jgi:hypothetical protein
MVLRHEVNGNVAHGLLSTSTSRLFVSEQASWGKPKKPNHVAAGTLVTESADTVIVSW